LKAIVIDETKPERPLVYCEVAEPVPTEMDLLVRVRAAGASRADLRKTGTHFAASDTRVSAVTGLEFAGEVAALGSKATGFEIGDRVMAFAGGANAELALVDCRFAIPVPPNMSWEQAAATPITFLTAFNAVVDAAKSQRGETVLIQGGSSSVGIAAMQIARARGAGKIFGTASTPEKLARIHELGCDVPINYRTEDFASVIKRETNDRGVDFVIDLIGGATANGNIQAARINGRIVCVGRIDDLATINLNEFSRKRINMIGVTFRTRSSAEREDIIRRFRSDILPLLSDGTLFPIVDCVFPLQEANRVLERVGEHAHIGKVVLII
jgi:NADPH2:quinone reductase